MSWWVLLAVVAVAAGLVWLAQRPPCTFVVRVAAGGPRAVRGTVTAAFLAAVREVCARHGVTWAEVRGEPRGQRIALVFSRSLPPAARQQLRNWWAMSGWPAPGAAGHRRPHCR